MSNVIELNREEITRLSRMEDFDGHAWLLYLILKNHMDHYTGIVNVDTNMLAQILQEKLLTDYGNIKHDINDYIRSLIRQLLKVDIISDYLLKNSILFIKLPIAYSETCVEDFSQH